MNPNTSDALILGGGVVGLAIAERLASRGLSVVLLERGELAREASWAAAGMLAPQSEMLEPGPYMDFCLRARRMHGAEAARLRDLTGVDPQYRDEGMIYAAFTEEQERTIRGRVAWQRPLGLRAAELTREEALALEPALTPELRMAAHFGEDHQLDPRLLTSACAAAARLRGARLIEGAEATMLLRGEGGRVVGARAQTRSGSVDFHAGATVLAAGSWSGLIGGQAAPPPTYPVKGQVLAMRAAAPPFAHTLHGADVYLVPRLDGRVIVGATEEHDSGYDKRVTSGAVSRLLALAFELAPALRGAEFIDAWAGLRPGVPDRMPIIGDGAAVGAEGLALATGHFRNGVLLAPLTAELVAELVIEGRAGAEIAMFSPARFA